MAYYLYKKIRDKQRQTVVEPVLNGPLNTGRNEVPATTATNLQHEEVEKPEGAPPHSDNTSASKEQKRAMRLYRWRIIAGLILPSTVEGLNTTMIAAALPSIASDFEQFAQMNWIITAFNLTAAAFIPAWGQFADVFGRYITIQAASLFMLFGSALCAGAPTSNFPMFLAGRGLQGAGAAGLLILMKVILADKVSLNDNAKNSTIFFFLTGIGYGVGPRIGGYLTSVSWRWCFIVSTPMSLMTLVLAHFVMRPVLLGSQDMQMEAGVEGRTSFDKYVKRLSTLDFGGQLTFLFGMGLIVLALTWAGAYYPWSDAKVIGPLVSGSLLIVIFFAWEYLLLPGRRMASRYPNRRPMVPLRLRGTRNAAVLMYINFITGMAMYAVFYFAALYFIVKDFDPDEAGVSLVFYLPGLAVGAYLTMLLCNVWPRQTWPPLALGTIVEAVGITPLACSLRWGHLPTIYGMLALTGVGTGVRLMPGNLHGVGYYRRHIASIISIMSFAISFGGTLASTIMLNILNNELNNAGINLAHDQSASVSSFSQIAHLSKEQQRYLRQKSEDGIVIAFLGISAFMWLGVILVVFLGNVDIKKSSRDPDRYEDGETDVNSLTKGSYLGSCFERLRSSSSAHRGETV